MRAAHTHTCAKLLQTAATITTTKLLAALSLAMWEERDVDEREKKQGAGETGETFYDNNNNSSDCWQKLFNYKL